LIWNNFLIELKTEYSVVSPILREIIATIFFESGKIYNQFRPFVSNEIGNFRENLNVLIQLNS